MTKLEPSNRLIGGRYRLDRTVGAGGMGTVWAGHDVLLDREVAVKEIRFPAELGEREQAELRERTLREARASARLSHPNVVRTYDVVEDGGRPWIVMELLPSRSLSTMLREDGPLAPHRVAEIGLALLAGLELSHREGVVHRDVKPDNVLITPDGRPVLTDFGIATMAGDPALTSTGVVLGSPAYMSPERARGQRPGPPSDLWSLGATLYSAVEGRPPFDRDNALGTLTAVLSEAVEPPRVEGPLRQAILGLLSKDPTERPDILTTRSLLERAAIEPAARVSTSPMTVAPDRADRTEAFFATPGPPVEASTASTTQTVDGVEKDHSSRRPLLAAIALLLCLVALGVVAYLTNDDRNRAAAPPTQKSTQQPTTKPKSTKPTPSPTVSSKPDNSRAARGFTTYDDPTGFSLSVPDDWQTSRRGTQVKFSEPGTARYLLVDQTNRPKKDPRRDWERQEKTVGARLANYQRISIADVDYRGYPAADWQFTYATQTQVLNRGFVAGDTGYALYIQGPTQSFDDSLRVFQRAADSFQPAKKG